MPTIFGKYRGTKMNLCTVKYFAKAIIYGSKYVYQTVPRLLTIWLDMGEHITPAITEVFKRLNSCVSGAIKHAPAYKVIPAPSLFTTHLIVLYEVVHCISSNCISCWP